MASWNERSVRLTQYYASSSTSVYGSDFSGNEIKKGKDFYGNYSATSYCDISPSDYGLKSIYVFADSTWFIVCWQNCNNDVKYVNGE